MNGLKLQKVYYDSFKNEGWGRIEAERPQRLEYASKLKIPHLFQLEPNEGKAVIVGASPSIADSIEDIKKLVGPNRLIFSLNGAHNYLIERGIIPNIHIIFEGDVYDYKICTKGPLHKDVYYYICSHCPKEIFEQLEGYNRVLWHCWDEGETYNDLIAKYFPGEFMVSGGFVTFFRAINIGLILGIRDFEFFGCDMSFTGEDSHYEGYNDLTPDHLLPKDKIIPIAYGTEDNYKIFKTTPFLAFLANEFMKFCSLHNENLKVKIHGDGMSSYMHKREFLEQYIDTNQISCIKEVTN